MHNVWLVLGIGLAVASGCDAHERPGDDSGPDSSSGEYALTRKGVRIAVTEPFRACTEDSDCVLVDVDCNGCCTRDAIAQSLQSVYDESKRHACSSYMGAICDCSFEDLEPRCIDARCLAEKTDYTLARAEANVVVNTKYRACGSDRDCKLVSTSCAGCCERDAIAVGLERTYDENFTNACADYEGAVCDCMEQPAEAHCIDAICVSQPSAAKP
jgi:hypothetical protein